MKATQIIGILLIVAAVIGFAVGGIPYTETSDVELGPLEVEASHEEKLPITPVAAGVLLVAGIGLVVVGRKKG